MQDGLPSARTQVVPKRINRSCRQGYPEHSECAQGNLREASLRPSRQMLPLRCAQGFGSRAQQDRVVLTMTALAEYVNNEIIADVISHYQ